MAVEARERSSVRVLLLSEDAGILALVREGLRPPAYVVRALPATSTALSSPGWWPDLAVFELEAVSAKDLRRHGGRDWTQLPVIGIARNADPWVRVRAFADDADDVVVAPCPPEELAARVAALLRRSRARITQPSTILTVGSWEIDLLHRRVRLHDHDLRLSALEQGILYVLASNAGRAVSREAILERLWGHEAPVNNNVIDRHIHILRRKLEALRKAEPLIETVPRRGYRLVRA